MRKRATSNENLFVVMNQISQEFAFILMRVYQHKSLWVGLCKIILGFIIIRPRVRCSFLFVERSFLFIVAMVTSRNYPFILVNIDQNQMNCTCDL